MSHVPNNPSPTEPEDDVPLEPWMLDVAREVVDDLDANVAVPREMMWKRIDSARKREPDHRELAPRHADRGTAVRSFKWRQIAAIAAVLVGGVAIGRYVVPSATTPGAAADSTAQVADRGSAPNASDPSRVAMQEHLAHTIALLAVVNDGHAGKSAPDIGAQARDLLTTTRLLLDQPQLRDSTTRRLLQDLELVLVQVIQARGNAPETERAPRETLKETNLLTRVRAVVTASSRYDAPVYGGN